MGIRSSDLPHAHSRELMGVGDGFGTYASKNVALNISGSRLGTHRKSHVAIEHAPFIDRVPMNISIYCGFSIAIFDEGNPT